MTAATKTRTRKSTTKSAQAAEQRAAERVALMDALDTFEPDEEKQDVMDALMRRYSERNTMLIMMQCPEVVEVHGYGEWQELGRQVRKGEHGIRILAPAGSKVTEEATDDKPERRRNFFKMISVFDRSQTDPAS